MAYTLKDGGGDDDDDDDKQQYNTREHESHALCRNIFTQEIM
jgi:hypothetical protein